MSRFITPFISFSSVGNDLQVLFARITFDISLLLDCRGKSHAMSFTESKRELKIKVIFSRRLPFWCLKQNAEVKIKLTKIIAVIYFNLIETNHPGVFDEPC